MKKNLLPLFILILIGIGVFFVVRHQRATSPTSEFPAAPRTNVAAFTCKDDKSVTAIFYPDDDSHVDLSLSDGRSLALPHATSGSGARYADAEESIVFWNKGDTAFIEEDGTMTFENCVVTPQ